MRGDAVRIRLRLVGSRLSCGARQWPTGYRSSWGHRKRKGYESRLGNSKENDLGLEVVPGILTWWIEEPHVSSLS